MYLIDIQLYHRRSFMLIFVLIINAQMCPGTTSPLSRVPRALPTGRPGRLAPSTGRWSTPTSSRNALRWSVGASWFIPSGVHQSTSSISYGLALPRVPQRCDLTSPPEILTIRPRTLPQVINGPTSDDQVAFAWRTFPGGAANISHQGTVETFDFDWQYYRASLPW